MADAQKRELPVAFLAGAVIVALLIAGAVWYSKHAASESTAPKALPMGAAEQAYAPQIKFLEPKMGRATNFLNQEVTFIFGTVENDGPRSIRQIEVTVEFHDVFNQVVLRDTERLFPAPSSPLDPGQQRDFQLSYEHVPQMWNVQYPSIRITGLDLK